MKDKLVLIFVILISIISMFIISNKIFKENNKVVISATEIEENKSISNINILAVYKENNSGEYEKQEDGKIPQEGYIIDSEKSVCSNNAIPSWNKDTKELIIDNLTKSGTSCYLYFYIPSDRSLANLGLKTSDVKGEPISFIGTACDDESCTDDNKAAGLYKGTDDDGITYYYRGNVTNNWVHFANMYWRIIRINGNGTIRLIYSGDSNPEETGKGTAINDGASVAFNTNYDDNKYVGFMYVGAAGSASGSYDGAHKINSSSTKSTILQTIETWYKGTSGIAEQYRDKLDGETGFCGDRELAPSGHGSYSGAGYAKQQSAYGPAHRTWTSNGTSFDSTQEPTFNCKKHDQDLYTTTDSEGGNKALTYPVGLITMDEVIFAGGLAGQNNTGYWLYTNQYYWTMSPSHWNSGYALVFTVNDSGSLSTNRVNDAPGVRPVINLKSNVSIKYDRNSDKDPGTIDNPYEVV